MTTTIEETRATALRAALRVAEDVATRNILRAPAASALTDCVRLWLHLAAESADPECWDDGREPIELQLGSVIGYLIQASQYIRAGRSDMAQNIMRDCRVQFEGVAARIEREANGG